MNQYQFQSPPITPINKLIIIAYGCVFILLTLLAQLGSLHLAGWLGLSANAFFKGHIYQLLTYPLIGKGLLEVVINGLILWFIGSELEALWGRKRYISFLLSASIGGGIIFLAISGVFFNGLIYSYPLSGLSGLVSSLCVAYAILFPDRMFSFMMIFPMKAKYFCMLLIGMSLYQGLFSPGGVLAWGHLGSIVCGVAFMFYVTHKGKRDSIKKRSGHLRLVDSNKVNGDKRHWH